MNRKLIEQLVRTFLDQHDLHDINFDGTPERVAEFWTSFLNAKRPSMPTFPTNNQQMVILKNHVAWGFCPHHLLPVEYTFKIGYIPQDKVVGLSKLARLADYYLSKLPLQENIPDLIVNDLHEVLKPLGVGCQVKGRHLCLLIRGVKSQSAELVTTSLKGVLLLRESSQQEFLSA